MSLYDAVVDPDERNTSHTLAVEMVGTDKTVLDVGCASGYLAEALNANGCTVSGIEIDPVAAEQARPKLKELVVGNLETLRIDEAYADSAFDRIVFGDVLEHLTDPVGVLGSALKVLADDGEIVVSVPHVAHGSVRLALLQGQWQYTDTGLLDRTHVRFFTLTGLVEMLSTAGLVVAEAWSTMADPLATEVDVAGDALPDGVVDWVRHQEGALDYQYVVRAVRGVPDGTLPEVSRVFAADEVRSDDVYTQRARASAEEEHRVLLSRDHIIGLEAQAARAESDLAVARAEIARLSDDLAGVTSDRAAVKSSVTWRAGRLLTSPMRLLRKATR